MEAFFSSLIGGDGLRDRVLECLSEALAAGQSRPVDVHIMTFSFTDERIARLLKGAAAHPNVTIRIVADWGQGSRSAGRQVRELALLGLPNLLVRYKHDQPYQWDAVNGRLRWSYRASRGLLHHKTLGIRIDRAPWKLICGSFNWTAKATKSYENLLVVTSDDDDSIELMRCVEREFEAIWCDGRVTLSPDEARAHYLKILEEYRMDPAKAPAAVVGLPAGQNATLPVTEWDDGGSAEVGGSRHLDAGRALAEKETRLAIAFSSRSPHDASGEAGYSLRNRDRRFDLYKPSGRVKGVPLTLTALALDVIARATHGHTLKVAIYGLSSRVPEYGALLDAARRGVRIQMLLDGEVGTHILSQLRVVRERDGLPIEIRAGRRMMHQKYIVHPETHTVLTGTANLSTDASVRHSEQRILIRENPAIAERFLADFSAIWGRLPASL